ncbi:hypothetical protein JZ751_027349 [Albula glossodonta]|uniref:Ig-like domain-containing protein n=1 Tax=Albula glossodonta TaxID=121402 RepID=A0A8T2MWP4_9TELE|nr:hypothetical protein JZ751_027349 [Albula glossodonta]
MKARYNRDFLVYQFGWTEETVMAAAGSTIKVTVGERVLFTVSPETNQNEITVMSFNNFVILSRSSSLKDSHIHDLYKDRVGIMEDGSIYMNNIQLCDAGLYHIITQYISENKPEKHSRFHLQVFEPVSKPNITAECLKDNITLSCFSSQGSEVTYSWETLPPCGNDSCVHLGQTMEIHLLPPSEPTSYVCAAQNPASRATSDPVVLGVCSTPRSPGSRWVLILCSVTATFCLIGIIMILCKTKKCVKITKKRSWNRVLNNQESTSYVCAAQNPVSRATSDPIDLGVCSTPRPTAETEST